ncbi:glycine--tRNA ligase subunit beta [Brevundimonas sp. 2R-24]|uniref:Glycine--tRNA ligase beta subunit n=1 Tax=Peiella sedimenti TaxID=3061083 RepID=A0ABT8SIX5_9CAUL|nr:glycine--tRNA ligase subunit beta [Caulobacteraceae bacterium XZ-24]
MPQLLLELFSEEIPARMQAGAARDLHRLMTERLSAAGLAFEQARVFAGPRRLTLVIDGLPEATPDLSEELKGPRTSAPDQALEGFLRKTGLTREQLTERDGVWFAEINRAGRPAAQVIAEAVDQTVRAFPWPKSMRWGSGTLRWVRPLKRIVCVFGSEVVAFDIDGIASGDETQGHRFLGSGQPFAVRDFDDYRHKLEVERVILDAAQRKARILEGARAVCAAKGLELVEDEGLLEEVAGLAEWPTPILGAMDPQFLDLPPEVVRLSMKTHQKYFAVRDPLNDRLAPHFVVVANVEASDGGMALAAGNARVLSARLNDARFFWDEDLKTGFDAWLKKLEGVTFHAKLGTMAERVERIAALAREIAPLVGADPDQAEQAARLAKADLASGMVGEFPELQGIMGGYYLRAAGSADAIADAVRDHYKPQGPNDQVPTAPLTVAVALADKLDTLVGFFAIDEKPTGSKDPFALRRAALGVIRLVLENGVRAPLRAVFTLRFETIIRQLHQQGRAPLEAAVEGLRPSIGEVQADQAQRAVTWTDRSEGFAVWVLGEADEKARDLLAFFADRLKVLLRDQGKRHDLVDAVFALGDDDLVRIVRRVEALEAFLATDDGANLLAGYRRAANILKAEAKKGPLPEAGAIDLAALTLDDERALAVSVAQARTDVDAALHAEDFAGAMASLARLRAPVDAFFEGVLVNSDIASERENRLRLLMQVRDVMGRVADFSQIGG